METKMKKRSAGRTAKAVKEAVAEVAGAVGELTMTFSDSAALPQANRTIYIDHSCKESKPQVTFLGEWTRRDIRTTLNCIVRAHRLLMAQKRKHLPVIEQPREQEN